jgi:hypothetical protein
MVAEIFIRGTSVPQTEKQFRAKAQRQRKGRKEEFASPLRLSSAFAPLRETA